MGTDRFVPAGALAAGVLFGLSSVSSAAVIKDYDSGIGPVADHPTTPAFDTWYDATSDAFATPAAGTLSASPSLRINDGGFTNGVYIIYQTIVPATDTYRLEADIDIVEDAAALNGIRAYQMGVKVNGAHRPTAPTPARLPGITAGNPGEAVGTYPGTLNTGDNNANPPTKIVTGNFTANAGDHLLIAFSTDVTSGLWNLNSGTWGTSHVLIDNLNLVPIPEPASLGLAGLAGLTLLSRRSRA